MSREDIIKELHRMSRKKFKRRPYTMRGIDDTFQADLVEMIPYAQQNKGYKYILVVIDTFSKFGWAMKLKNKTGKEVTNAMHNIFKSNSNRIPRNLQTDAGKEFYNSIFRKLMEKYKINHYCTFSHLKASICERFNRTLLNRIWYRFTLQGSQKWIGILSDIVDSYNSTVHRTIQMRPVDVTKSVERMLLKTAYKTNSAINVSHLNKFNVNDFVRISKYKTIFEKSYTPNWSAEIFKIVTVLPTEPVTYKLSDLKDVEIKGCFYELELQKTKHPNTYLVEKIIRRKQNKVFVKWLGFPSSENSWINASELD